MANSSIIRVESSPCLEAWVPVCIGSRDQASLKDTLLLCVAFHSTLLEGLIFFLKCAVGISPLCSYLDRHENETLAGES